MRVAIVSDYFPPVSPGGAELSALHLANALHPHVGVEVVTTDFGVRPELPFPVHYISLAGVDRSGGAAVDPRLLFEDGTAPFSRGVHYIQFSRKLAALAKSRDFDLIHTQQIGSEVSAYIGRPLHRLPRVTTVRGYRHLAGKWVDDAAQRHGVANAAGGSSGLSKMKRIIPRVAVRSGEHIFTVSEFVRRAFVTGGLAEESSSSAVFNILPTTEPSDADDARARDLLSEMNGPVLLFVGRLTDGKGLSLLIDAMPDFLRQIPEATLVVVGGGDQTSYRAKAAANLASYGVIFAGHVSNGVVRSLIRQANAVVMPSLHHEPLGRVLLEAIAESVPVVATRYGGTPEVIEHGKNGLLIDPVDSKSLASSLLTAVKDRGLADHTDEFDRELVTGRLNPMRTVEATLDVYERAVAA